MNTISSMHAFKASRPADGPDPSPAPAPTPAPPAPADATFSYNAQDEVVFPAGASTVHGVSTDGGLNTDKTQLSATLAPAADGTYVYDAKDQTNQTAALSFAACNKTVDMMSAALGSRVSWAFDGKLGVVPDAGEDFNAYYARDSQNINFFHGTDPVTNQNIMSGASGEVVSHETGHAILDGLRPAYFSSFTPDVGAFHESWGDMMGMFMAMQDDKSVALAVQQTGGDLSKDNCLCQTGEELGIAINDVVGQNVTGGPYVRNANNTFKWADPNTLPQDGPPDQLQNEVHSFSRLWTGAMYDILKGIQSANMASGMDPASAIKATGAEGIKMYANLMKDAPQADFTYADMANALVSTDQKYNNGAHTDLITKVMTDRGILGAQPAPPPPPDPGPDPTPDPGPPSGLRTMTSSGFKPLEEQTRKLSVKLSGPEFGQFQGARVDTLVDRDGSLGQDAESKTRLKQNVAKAIQAGRVLYTEPNAAPPKPKDLFDAKGRPYIGVVRWEGGQMVIERAKVVT